jgi:hypothetical protein
VKTIIQTLMVPILLVLNSFAIAQTDKKIFENIINDTNSSERFFFRQYSNKYLQLHKEQRVQKIVVSVWLIPVKAQKMREILGIKDDRDVAYVGMYFKFRDISNWYSQGRSCFRESHSQKYNKCIDSPVGESFSVEQIMNGQVLLNIEGMKVGRCGITIEEYSENIKDAITTIDGVGDYVFIASEITRAKFANVVNKTKCTPGI